jgi:hypothetical protein
MLTFQFFQSGNMDSTFKALQLNQVSTLLGLHESFVLFRTKVRWSQSHAFNKRVSVRATIFIPASDILEGRTYKARFNLGSILLNIRRIFPGNARIVLASLSRRRAGGNVNQCAANFSLESRTPLSVKSVVAQVDPEKDGRACLLALLPPPPTRHIHGHSYHLRTPPAYSSKVDGDRTPRPSAPISISSIAAVPEMASTPPLATNRF